MVVTVCNALFLLIYLLSAAVQYNDPDALLWASLYLAAAVMCAMRFRHNPARWPARLMLVISIVWMGNLLPGIVGQVSLAEIFASISMQTQAVEEAREIGGLFLVGIWSAALIYFQRTR